MSATYGSVDVESWLVEWASVNPRNSARSSGAMNCGVPFTVDGVPRLSSIRFEMPKSAILIHHGSGGWDLIRIF
jgi:hypothetical protein